MKFVADEADMAVR